MQKVVFNRTKWGSVRFSGPNVGVLRSISRFVLKMGKLMLMIVIEFVTKKKRARTDFAISTLLKEQTLPETILLSVLKMGTLIQISLF